MKPKGTILVSMNYTDTRGLFTQFEKHIQGEYLSVMDFETGCDHKTSDSFWCILHKPAMLVDIPRKFVVMFHPFVKKGHLMIPSDLGNDIMAESTYISRITNDLGSNLNNPTLQLQWIYKNFPEYWEREQKGEFYPNGSYMVAREMEVILQKHNNQ